MNSQERRAWISLPVDRFESARGTRWAHPGSWGTTPREEQFFPFFWTSPCPSPCGSARAVPGAAADSRCRCSFRLQTLRQPGRRQGWRTEYASSLIPLSRSRRISPDLLGRRRVRAHGEESSTRGIFPAGSLRVRPAAVRSWRGQTPTVNGLLLGLRRELSPQKREIGRATTLRHSGVYTAWDLI